MCLYVYVCVSARARVCACVRACARACVRDRSACVPVASCVTWRRAGRGQCLWPEGER